jgi:hypothetical protein
MNTLPAIIEQAAPLSALPAAECDRAANFVGAGQGAGDARRVQV